MKELVVVYITAPSADEGARIARALVEERLAACVNRIGGVSSIYRWQGKVEESAEELLIVKTSREKFEALRQRVGELHRYSVPEIIALPIIDGSESYLDWLRTQIVPVAN